ncbi:MAG: hypothetical protein GXY44_00380 [Phycisphaerales bacterium]|nr:hypothetical protein [Phycisphaerales bacterium]
MADTEKRWSAWMVFFTGVWRPAVTARRTQHVTLRKAWLIHLVAAVLAVLLVSFLASLSQSFSDERYVLAIWLDDFAMDMVSEFVDQPLESAVVTGLVALSIEAGFLVLAFLLMPWGAADEKMRSSYAAALRQCWLYTADALPIILLVSAVIIPLGRAHESFYRNNSNWYEQIEAQMPAQPELTTTNPTTQELEDFNKAMAEWNDQHSRMWNEMWDEAYRRRPWHVRHGGTIIGYTICLTFAWLLWILLRAAGAKRSIAPIPHPPTCEFCGYNLLVTPMDSRCPECGEPVLNSLAPDVRPGTPWEHRREVGFLKAWWRCSVDAVFRPQTIGRQIRLITPGTAHRWFFASYLPIFFLIGYAMLLGMVQGHNWATGDNEEIHSAELLLFAGPAFGYINGVCVVAILLLAAGLVGIYYRISETRNLLSGTIQAACYLSGYIVFWSIINAVAASAAMTLWWMLSLGSYFSTTMHSVATHANYEYLLLLGWLGVNLVCFGVYLWLIVRIMAAARSTNK